MMDARESCPGVPIAFTRDERTAVIKTAQLRVTFNIERGSLSFYTADGDPLLNEGDRVPRTYEPVELNGEPTYHVADRFTPTMAEAFYGLGQHQGGMFNYRGATVELGQNNTDVAIPLLVSSKGYAVMWNTAAFTYVDNRFPLELTFSSLAGKSVDYYFLYGPEMDSVIHQYRTLTGHTPMLPKWAYGFFQSKDRYVSLDEIRDIAQRYRQEHIPLDAVVQDWFWWKTEGDPAFNANYHACAEGARSAACPECAHHDLRVGLARSRLRNVQGARLKTSSRAERPRVRRQQPRSAGHLLGAFARQADGAGMGRLLAGQRGA